MSKNVLGFIIFVIVGVLGILGYYFFQNVEMGKTNNLTSDASRLKGNIKIGVDNWIGYFPLCSPHMKKLTRGAGYLVECEDDNADYPGRMKKLKTKELNLAVATVDSFLINAKGLDFPATIIMIIDESKGGDAVVAHKDKISKIDDLKNKKNYRIAFTPASPSEHLLRSLSVHFDIPELSEKRGSWRVETDGSSAALKKLLDNQVEVAVLWEPDVSKALNNKNIVKILGTEDTEKLIVDILLAQREYMLNNPDSINVLISNYFRTLNFYKKNPEQLLSDVKSFTGLSSEKVKAMLKGVKWINMYDNASAWFGINPSNQNAGEGLVDTLQSTSEILINTKAFKEDPIPESNPYSLQNRSFIEKIFNQGLAGSMGGEAVGGIDQSEYEEKTFSKLSANEWNALREVGTFRIRPITFQSGTSKLDTNGRDQLKEAVEALKHYPNFRVIVAGHTGLRGDKKANEKLSGARAKSVKKYLIDNLSIDTNRLWSVGYGSKKPLPRKPGESYRAYNYRLPRVELKLVAEVY